MALRPAPPDRTAAGTTYPDAVQLECGRFAVRMSSGIWRTVKALPKERGLYWCGGGCHGDEPCPAHHVPSVAMRPWWTPDTPYAYALRHIGAFDTYIGPDRWPLRTRDASSFVDQEAFRKASAALKFGDDLVILTVDATSGLESTV